MTYEDFLRRLEEEQTAPTELTAPLQALWYERKGDWKKAHELIDHLDDHIAAHVHAYLHRVEGDLGNAQYWYHRAQQPIFKGTTAEEWHNMVRLLLR
ncbi:hypothetical protein [Sphingobacterium griseoflavum]|uniref:CdiI immunity protein domain-containing protein n=1 Tax=Sphingobacterium griseoflavum TaxID=1474952 RepID=A0ABQ3HPB9_9SPHI|nr:hypothetical protein [Sphingobacterium griseoflavum]GHE23080.1 hypothetical protein GCM10017764_00480 [Sphingobacterium griseoflavum]